VNREGAIWEKTIDDNFKEKKNCRRKEDLKTGTSLDETRVWFGVQKLRTNAKYQLGKWFRSGLVFWFSGILENDLPIKTNDDDDDDKI